MTDLLPPWPLLSAFMAFTVVKFAGAGYLIDLGIQALRAPETVTGAAAGSLVGLVMWGTALWLLFRLF
jgi:threonine/homoserine/homoserine lactone efflux protein